MAQAAQVASDDLATPEAADTELSRSETVFLNAMAGLPPGTTPQAAGTASPSPAVARKADAKPTTPAPESMSSASGSAETPCQGACRAYASMQRAASRLCELAGKENDRCAAAQGRVERATQHLKSACPVCESVRD